MVIDFMLVNKSAAVQDKVDSDSYRDDELISIKTPLTLPYYTSSETFEKIYGSVEVDGIVYQYVKRRVYQGTLELLCLPDHSKQQMQSVKNEILKLTIDGTPSKENNRSANFLKISLPDFYQNCASYSISTILVQLKHYNSAKEPSLLQGYTSTSEKPPEAKQLFI